MLHPNQNTRSPHRPHERDTKKKLNLEMYYSLLVGAAAAAVYLWYRHKSRKYPLGSRIEHMDPVSSSMILSEVEPQKGAQCSIVTLLVFDSKLSYKDFIDRFVENFILSDPHSRFNYRMDPATFSWIRMDSTWSPRENCSRVSGVHNIASAHSLVANRLVEPLSIHSPLWALAFVENFTDASGKECSAAILTIHHSMGDGFTLCHQMIRRAASANPSLTMHQCYPFQAPPIEKRSFSLTRTFSMMVRVMKSISKLLLMSPDPAGALRNKSPRSVTDPIAVGMFPIPISVSELKKIAKEAESMLHQRVHGKVSLNDLVVAAVAIALGDIFPSSSDRHDVTSAIWVGLKRKSVVERPKNPENDWGNQNLGVSYLQLPTKLCEPIDILLECHTRLHAMKNSPEPLVANKLLRLIGSLPSAITWPLRHVLMDKISTSVSNFPGPTHPIKLPVAPDGRPNATMAGVGTLKDVFFLVAPPLSFGPYVTIISYNGAMYLSLAVAERLVPQSRVSELVQTKIPEAFLAIQAAIKRLPQQQ
jgi:hypothetical protein